MYQTFGAKVTTDYDSVSAHGLPTKSTGWPCGVFKSPYIYSCGKNYVKAGLAAVLDRTIQDEADSLSTQLREFD